MAQIFNYSSLQKTFWMVFYENFSSKSNQKIVTIQLHVIENFWSHNYM